MSARRRDRCGWTEAAFREVFDDMCAVIDELYPDMTMEDMEGLGERMKAAKREGDLPAFRAATEAAKRRAHHKMLVAMRRTAA